MRVPIRLLSTSCAAAFALALLTGCVGARPAVPTATASPTPTASRSADPRPSLHPDGTATDNLPLFAAVTAQVWTGVDQVKGRAYIDALVAAGFDKAAMQVTSDVSTIGRPAESIEFAVRWHDECLVGQVGPAIGSPVTAVLPLAGSSCLVGKTRPIDW